MKVFVIFASLAVAFASFFPDYDIANYYDVLVASVSYIDHWPQNDEANAGALFSFAYSDIADGSCYVDLPSSVNLFHVMNGHIVPGDRTNPVKGDYQVAAPAGWEAINGSLNALLIYERDNIFNTSAIVFTCDQTDVADLSVYSFPQNNLVKETSSNVHYRPGFHQGDVLTITLPAVVARFNITGADNELEVDRDGRTTFRVSGFKNDHRYNDMKEVHFSLEYLQNEDATIGDNWFSAGQVTVTVTQEEVEEDGDDDEQ